MTLQEHQRNLEIINEIKIEDLRDQLSKDLLDFTEEEIQLAFQNHIKNLIDNENAYYAEQVRLQDIYSRWGKLKDVNASFNSVHPNIPNNEAWLRDNLITAPKEEAERLLKQLEVKDEEIFKEFKKTEYKKKRREEYEKQGLTFEVWVEMDIEDDKKGQDEFRAKRPAVKLMFPKPEETPVTPGRPDR